MSDARGRSLHFAATHIGKCLLWGAEGLLSLYVMTVLPRIAPTTAGLLFGLAFGGVLLFAWTRLSELACAGDARGAARDYGLYTALSKVGTGVSGFVAGDWLAEMPGAIVAVDTLWPLIAVLATVRAAIGLLGALGPKTQKLATAAGQHGL